LTRIVEVPSLAWLTADVWALDAVAIDKVGTIGTADTVLRIPRVTIFAIGGAFSEVRQV
jgi:hypothetical protein